MKQLEPGQKRGADTDSAFSKVYLRLPRNKIGYVRFVLEGYDGLGFIRTIFPAGDIVEFSYSPSQAELARDLLAALAVELPLEEVPAPESSEPL